MTPEMAHLKDLVSLRDTPPEAREDWQVQRILALALGSDACGLEPGVPGEEGEGWSVIKGAPSNLQAALARQGLRVSVPQCALDCIAPVLLCPPRARVRGHGALSASPLLCPVRNMLDIFGMACVLQWLCSLCQEDEG